MTRSLKLRYLHSQNRTISNQAIRYEYAEKADNKKEIVRLALKTKLNTEVSD